MTKHLGRFSINQEAERTVRYFDAKETDQERASQLGFVAAI